MNYKLYELHYTEFREQIETYNDMSIIERASADAKFYKAPVDIWHCDSSTGRKTEFMCSINPDGENSDKPFYKFKI